MLVGAYRDNEVSSSHPLMRTLAAIRKGGARMQEIVLSPLELEDVGRLVTDALHSEGDSGHPLAHLVHEKTGGNLTLEEQRLLENSLTELRFRYVQALEESKKS